MIHAIEPMLVADSSPRSVQDRVRSRRREEYRRAILDAAEEVFGRSGFGATKMSSIASAAGVATGTLYNYFDSKDEVFAALFERIQTQLIERISAAAARARGLAAIEAIVHEILSRVQDRGPLYMAMLEAMASFDRGAVDMEVEKKVYFAFRDRLARAIEQAVEQGELREDIDVEILASALQGSCHACMMGWMFKGGEGSVVDRADVILELFVKGAQPR